jgi:hypothetical protein
VGHPSENFSFSQMRRAHPSYNLHSHKMGGNGTPRLMWAISRGVPHRGG